LLIDQPKLRILEVTDYDGEDHRITVLDGGDWKVIEPGAALWMMRLGALR